MPHDSNELMTAAVSTIIQSGDPLAESVCLGACVNSAIALHAAVNAPNTHARSLTSILDNTG